MPTFIVTGAGHSGTRLLSLQLGAAPGWTVMHEPDDLVSARLVSRRFEGRENYGEVNSFLLTSARYVPADHKAVLLRNPYDVVRSIVRGGEDPGKATTYVREAISILDNLARDGLRVIKFRGIIRSRKYVVACARRLGIESLEEGMVKVKTRINHHIRPATAPEVPEATVNFSKTARDEFDLFIYTYGL